MPQAMRVSEGRYIDYTPDHDVSAGSVEVLGNLVGVAERAISANTLGALACDGTYDLAKADSVSFALGAPVFWDADGNPKNGTAGTGAIVSTASGNKFAGFAVKAAASGDETVRVLLLSVEASLIDTLSASDLADVGSLAYTAGKLLVADGNSYEEVAVSGDATLAYTGALTLAASKRGLVNTIADPGDAGASAVTGPGSVDIVTAGAETRTLADPTFRGQQISLCMKTDGGDCVITAASAINQTGNNTITMNDAGDSLQLVAIQVGNNLRWRVVYNDGCTLSTV